MNVMISNKSLNELGMYSIILHRDLSIQFVGKIVKSYFDFELANSPLLLIEFFPELSGSEKQIDDIFDNKLKKFSLKSIKRKTERGDILFDLFIFPAKNNEDHAHIIIQDKTHEAQTCMDVIETRNEMSFLCDKLIMKSTMLGDLKDKALKERDLLAKYFSRDLIDGILDGTISTKLGGEIRIASILFCDLRNSTTIAENIEPELFMKLLNNLFTDLTDIIFGENGSVNKFLGDGILATFGCPKEISDDALHCANVAVKIRKYLFNFNQFRPKYLKDPISMGVGIARGKLFTGNFGSVNQIEYSVLGDPVNIASRLESLTREAGCDILLDGNIRDELGDRVEVERLELNSVKGKLKEVSIYKLLNFV